MSSKPNIPTKSSGDTFSAQELNTIVDFFENKPDADELIPGPEGPQGIQGPEGPKGDDGQSAYDIAVNNGFVGTEQEWLESLSPVRYMDGDIFEGDGETPETKTTLKYGSIGEEKLSEEVRAQLGLVEVISVKKHGAKGDAKIFYDATVTSGSNLVSSTSTNFTESDIGKTIGIPYAGAGSTVGQTVVSTIVEVINTTTIRISSTPTKSIVGERTINDGSITRNSTTLNSPSANFTTGDVGKKIEIPGAGLQLGNNMGSPQPCYITQYISPTSVLISRKSLATISNVSVSIPGATIIYGTDDTIPLQNAIDLGSQLQMPVSLGVAGYLTTDQLHINDYLKVIGQGAGSSIIYPVGSGISAIRGQGRTVLNPFQDVHFKDFEINCIGVRVNTYGTGNKGIYITHMDRPIFRNLYIRNSSATGLGCDFLRDYEISNCVADHCGAQVFEFSGGGGGSGIGIGTGRYHHEAGILIGNTANDCGNRGIFLESQGSNILSTGAKIIGNFCSWNKDCGIGDYATEGTIIIGNTCTYNGSGIRLNVGFVAGLYSKNTLLQGNILKENGFGISLLYKEGLVKVLDNIISLSSKSIEVTIVSGGDGSDLELRGNNLSLSAYESIHLISGNLSSLRIKDNMITDSGSNRPAILCKMNIGRLYLKNNEAYDNRATKSQTYGFEATGTSNISRFVHGGNDFSGNSMGEMKIDEATIGEVVLH